MENNDATGVLLVGHGTRDRVGQEQFLTLARRVAERLAVPLEPCFLELCSPLVDAGIERLLSRGLSRMVVAPLLLFSAGHAQRDVPDAVRQALGSRTDLEVLQAEPLGLLPSVVEQSHWRWLEAIENIADFAADDSLLVMIGRGSSDAEATRAMYELAALRAQRSGVGQTRVGFAAVSSPTVDEVLGLAAGSPQGTIVVQPHLMFSGELWNDIASRVAIVASNSPTRNWRVTGPLGPTELMAEAVVTRMESAAVGGLILRR